MIDISCLRFAYPRGGFALSIPEFAVCSGERVAVIGPSGTGKTTLLNLIAGILVPDQGEVIVNGTSVSALADGGRRNFRIANIGFVFQDFELIDYLNVLDNILHPYRITGVLKLDARVKERATGLTQRMGIGDKLTRSCRDLSQGEKQRVAICRALLTDPDLILADEATGNLDPENKSMVLDLLYESIELSGATLLAVTHDHELLPRFDRVLDFAQFRASGAE